MLTPEWPVGTRVRLRVSLLERCGLEPPCGADEGVIVGVYGMAPPRPPCHAGLWSSVGGCWGASIA